MNLKSNKINLLGIQGLKFVLTVLLLPSGGTGVATTNWITVGGTVHCDKDPLINLQAFSVYFYDGENLNASTEIDKYGNFKTNKFTAVVGPHSLKLVKKSNGVVIDSVLFKHNKFQNSFSTALNACP